MCLSAESMSFCAWKITVNGQGKLLFDSVNVLSWLFAMYKDVHFTVSACSLGVNLNFNELQCFHWKVMVPTLIKTYLYVDILVDNW